jgi:hypothetical protein
MARVCDRVLTHNGVVNVGVVNDRCVYPHHCGVIRKHAALPHAADETDAHEAEAVVHATVVAD